jgi:V/A-type H+/Na+-transporting ATPase subunit E
MESLKLITEAILQEAKDSADKKIREAEELVDASLEKQRLIAIQKATEEAQTILRRAEDEAEIYKSHILADAKIKLNWACLLKKELWIEKVLNEARNKIKATTQTKKYIHKLEKLIVEAGVLLDGKDIEVILNQQDSNLKLDLDNLADLICEKTSVKPKVGLSTEKANIIGGAIVRTVDGKLVMDNSFDDILKRREKELRKMITQNLFS